MTFAELQQAFRDWTLTATGLAGSVVYWTHQDVPRPDGPCLSLHVRNPGRQRGHDGGHVVVEPRKEALEAIQVVHVL